MTSKNLSLAKWKENLKRRSWTAILCCLTFLCIMPVYNLMSLSSFPGLRYAGYDAVWFETHKETLIKVLFLQNAGYGNMVQVLAIIFFGIVFAVQGFSWLYSKKKQDMYLSVPFSSRKRFLLIYGNGILVFTVSYIIAWVLQLLVGILYGAVDIRIMGALLLIGLCHMLGFLAIYHLALMCVMLTGNLTTALLGMGVFASVEYIVKVITAAFMSQYYRTYSMYENNRFLNRPVLSPFFNFFSLADSMRVYTGGEELVLTIRYSGAGIYIFLLMLVALLTGTAAYILYKKRPSERCGQALSIKAFNTPVKLIVLFVVSLAVGIVSAELTDWTSGFIIAGILVGALVCHCLVQFIYEKDLRACFKKKWHPFAAAAAGIVFFIFFNQDLGGYDRFLPDAEEVETVSITLENDYSYTVRDDLLGKRDYIAVSNALIEQMNSADQATIEAVLSMMENDHTELKTETKREDGCQDSIWLVSFRLKNGRKVTRRMIVDSEKNIEAVNTVLTDENYRRVRYQMYSAEFEKCVDRMTIKYCDGVETYLFTGDSAAFLKQFQADFEQLDYSFIKENLPVGYVTFTCTFDKSDKISWSYPYYESFANTKAILAEDDILSERTQGNFFTEEDIQSIGMYFYREQDKEQTASGMEATEAVAVYAPYEDEHSLIYSDPEEIKKLLPCLYPGELESYKGGELYSRYESAKPGEIRFQDLNVTFTTEFLKDKHYSTYVTFLREEIPEFVYEDALAELSE